jgi:predicted phage tail protein
MVAPTADAESTRSDPAPDDPHGHPRGKGGVRRLTASVVRLVNIQVKIWLTQAKVTAMKVGLFAGLFAAAAVVAVLAIIFLYIGVFRVLTDVVHLQPVWAFLIFGGVHLLLAAVLVMVAIKILTKKENDDDDDKQDASKPTAGSHASHTPAGTKERS